MSIVQHILRRRSFLLAAFLIVALFSPPVHAQNARQVRGTVYDELGDPFPGVVIVNRKLKIGVSTDADGKFVIPSVPSDAVLTVEIMGYKSQDIRVSDLKGEAQIYLELDAETLEETVVTGIFTRRKDSFTGSVQAVTSDQLKSMSNTNVIASLKNIDPSMLVLDNLAAGSDPNAMANIQIRGASTLSVATTQDLKSDYLNSGNTPLFILDGFETSLQKITDMDMNRVQSITILKDASAKAIYGSKGANGVIVIETKALTGNRSQVTYNGSVAVEMPDLSSYNLCNSLEKLEVERRYDFYMKNCHDSNEIPSALELYNQRLKRALEGEDTYWLSKPLRTGISQKHSLAVELGGKDIKAMATFAYNQTNGAMKGSFRRTVSGDVNLSYRLNKWTFRNIMSIAFMNNENSPYGNFSEYARLNPYYTPYDEDGNLKKVLFSNSFTGSNGIPFGYGAIVTNPMYNAIIGTRYANEYMDFTDNLYVEYQMFKSLRLVGRAGVNSQRTKSEDFRPAEHTDFVKDTGSDDLILRRGSYNVSNGSYLTFSADLSAQFNQKIAGVHDIFATAQYNISETNYEEITHYTEGFPNSNMHSITFARQYAQGAIPTGGDGLNRNLGALLTTGYSYDNRYMADATLKGSASSVFGTNNRWGLFWSAGLAWNIHNERFIKDSVYWIKQLKLRASVGSSGNQNFTSNTSLPVYRYFSSGYYNGFSGAYLTNMENPTLGWEEKMDYNVGIDFRTRRINMVLDAYIADTRNLMFSRSILPSTGFSYVSDNLGLVRNKGVELQLSYMLYQRGASYLSVFGKIATNDNRILRISDEMDAFNKQQQAVASETNQTAPVIQYFDGVPLHAVWTVPSLGIDPVTGHEIFIKQDGSITDTWSATDLRFSGSSDPLFNGNFGVNGEIKGFGFNFVATFYGGGYLYNSTLVDKVENTFIENNVDRRIFTGRWYEPGQVAPYRDGGGAVYYEGSSIPYTRPTSRFVQKNNVLNLSSISLYYEFPVKLVRSLGLQRLRTTLYANDLYTFSSIEIERGTSYPYARSFSLAVTATF